MIASYNTIWRTCLTIVAVMTLTAVLHFWILLAGNHNLAQNDSSDQAGDIYGDYDSMIG